MASVSRHRAGVRATVPAVQVRGECSYGTCRRSQQARLGLLPSLSSSSAVVQEEEEEEEESLFKADAVNEEDSERDRATQV